MATKTEIAVPNVAGTWKIRRSDNIIMKLDQSGPKISSEFTTAAGFEHELRGDWNEATHRFDYTIRRRNVRTGCITEMFGHLTKTSDKTIQTLVVGSDGRCDLPNNFQELADWDLI